MADLVTRLLLNNSLFDNSIRHSTNQIHRFKTSAEKASKNIYTLQGSIMRASTNVSGFANSFTNLASKGNMALATLTAFGAAGIDSLRRFADFELSMKHFQGILGICTEEMEYFNLEAIRLGATTTQTASQVAKAFTMIAGRLPQLLDNKEALVEVTLAAITLAEAATMTVDDAGTALANSLNQMGAEASNATDYINVLAAGSRNGAGNIIYLTEAMKKIGNTTASVGMSFEETVAAIEMLAKTGVVAGSAGRLIRAIIGALEKQMNDKLKPSIVGINVALENLAKMLLTTADYFNMFGVENQGAARTLVQSRLEYDRLTKTITGTNTAINQAKTNTDNLKGAVTRLDSAWEELCLTITGGNFWKNVVDDAANYLGVLTDIVLRLKDIESFNNKKGSELSERYFPHYKDKADELLKSYSQKINPETGKKYSKKEAANYIKENKEKLFPDLYDKKVMFADPNDSALATAESSEKTRLNLDKKLISFLDSFLKTTETKTNSPTATNILNTLKGIQGKNEDEVIKNKIAYLKDLISKGLDLQTEYFANGLIEQLEKQLGTTTEESVVTQILKTGDFFSIPIRILPNSLKELEAEKSGIILQMNNANSPSDYLSLKARLDLKEAQIEDWKNGGGMRIKGLDVSKAIPLLFDSEKVKQTSDFADSLNAVASAMSSVSQMTNEGAGAWITYAANALTATATMVQAILKLIIAKQAEAAANSAASAAQTPVVGWLLVAGAIAATIASFAAIPKFANGGIISGNSTIGDMNLARVNAGEMILNNRQQRNLFNLLNGNGSGSSGSKVEFKIQGKELVGVLHNYNNKLSKVK